MPAIYAVKATSPWDAVVYDMESVQLTRRLTVLRNFVEDDCERPTLNDTLRDALPQNDLWAALTGNPQVPTLFERLSLEKIAPRSPDIQSWN